MGYQQFLMLILALLIIGVAVSVGLDMFNQNSRNINRQSIISEMNIYAGVANAFYKAPVSLGGGGRAWDVDRLGYWLGFNYDPTTGTTSSNNGIYTFSSSGDTLTIIGVGTETGNNNSTNLQASMTIQGTNCQIVTIINN
ncbi:MAG: hypothetical protein H8E11_00040 [Candidatus Cloacimonetes bacterium]|nr:hypothetical protein [Candidatus Cloacimonadota bacterium]